MLPKIATGPGEGERWQQLASWLRDQVPTDEVDGIWVFRVVRRDRNEYGTAVLSLVSGERRRILTARYVATVKGRERGGWVTELDEVGSGPIEALEELLELVPIRADDEDPPASVDPLLWFAPLEEVEEEDSPESVEQAEPLVPDVVSSSEDGVQGGS